MNKLNVNIDAQAVISQNEQENAVPTKKENATKYDVKNYLAAYLKKKEGETSKKLKIRLLPFSPEGGSPFQKVFIHTVKVNSDVSPSGYKTFICPKHNHKGDACPFCETSEGAKKLRRETTDEVQKKKWGEIEFSNSAKEAWIVRCIERDHEDEGVKFWMFNASKKRDGIYDRIVNIFNERYSESMEATGEPYNIFDLNNGKDLIINLSKDNNGKTVTQVSDSSFQTPLSKDYDKALSWINDEKKWDEVFTVKPYDYMAIVVGGGVPVYDKVERKYVDKEEKEKADKLAEKQELEENITEQKKDFTQFVNDKVDLNQIASFNGADEIFVNDSSDDDGLPF